MSSSDDDVARSTCSSRGEVEENQPAMLTALEKPQNRYLIDGSGEGD
jgi:hypothetical protein